MSTKKRSSVTGSSSAGKNRKREPVKLASDSDLVLAKCRALTEKLRENNESSATPITDHANKVPKDIVEVDELSATEVLEGIEGVALQITRQVLNKKGFSMEIPSRAASNQIYVKEWDRIVLGGKRIGRNFMNVRESRKSAITLRVMQLLHAVLVKRIHITKRDLFYTDVKLFVDQAESDGVLDDVATMIGCTRSNLHVVASDKGLVVGRYAALERKTPSGCNARPFLSLFLFFSFFCVLLSVLGRIQFEEDGDPIDCTRYGRHNLCCVYGILLSCML